MTAVSEKNICMGLKCKYTYFARKVSLSLPAGIVPWKAHWKIKKQQPWHIVREAALDCWMDNNIFLYTRPKLLVSIRTTLYSEISPVNKHKQYSLVPPYHVFNTPNSSMRLLIGLISILIYQRWPEKYSEVFQILASHLYTSNDDAMLRSSPVLSLSCHFSLPPTSLFFSLWRETWRFYHKTNF